MTLGRKRAHLDESNTIRFGRFEIGIALVTMLTLVSSVVGNYFIASERSERNTKAISTLVVQVQALTTSQAVTVANVRHIADEIGELKSDIREDRK